MAITALIEPRVFNDCPTSTLLSGNSYPTSVYISDTIDAACVGFSNLHIWTLSTNGSSSKLYANNSSFSISADVTISGTCDGQGGLKISPWWSNSDGLFSLNSSTGEIACYGGRLPFYSFTISNSITYTKGTTVNLKIIYRPHSLTSGDPATMEYIYNNGTGYTSGPLPFDEGNPAEGYGSWGILNDATVGAFEMVFIQGSTQNLYTSWNNIVYTELNNSSMFLMF